MKKYFIILLVFFLLTHTSESEASDFFNFFTSEGSDEREIKHDFALSTNDNTNSSLLMLGDELYEVDSLGNLHLLNKDYLDQRGYAEYNVIAPGALILNTHLIRLVVQNAIRWLWQNLNKVSFFRALRKWIFPRKISDIEKVFIKNSKIRKGNGRQVAQRDDIISKYNKCSGTDSCSEMSRANAPFDKWCQRIQLHHLLQETDGLILELTELEHKTNSKVFHQHTNMSEVDRKEFQNWKRGYWRERYEKLCR